MTLLDLIKEHWFFSVIMIVAITASTSWSIINNLYIEPLHLRVEQQRIEITSLKDKVQTVEEQEIEIDYLKNALRVFLENKTTPEIKIIRPKNEAKVSFSTIVSGTIFGKMPEGQNMWVIINPNANPSLWWPQVRRITPLQERWSIPIWIGREKEDIGMKFDIAVILVNEKDDQYFQDYLQNGQRNRDYSGILIPDSVTVMDQITVTRI